MTSTLNEQELELFFTKNGMDQYDNFYSDLQPLILDMWYDSNGQYNDRYEGTKDTIFDLIILMDGLIQRIKAERSGLPTDGQVQE